VQQGQPRSLKPRKGAAASQQQQAAAQEQ